MGSSSLQRTKPYAAHQLQEVSAETYEYIKTSAGHKQGKKVFEPTSFIALLWSYSVLAFDMIYIPFVLPIVIGFIQNNTTTGGYGGEWGRAWHWLAGGIYLVDIFFKLNCGFLVASPGKEMSITDRSYILWHYLNPLVGGGFIIDLLSVIPLIYELVAVRSIIGDLTDQILSLLMFSRIIYVTNFSIWLYLKSLSGWHPRASLWDRVPNGILLCSIMLHTILGCMQIFAGGLYCLARWEGEERSWVQGRADSATEDGYHIDTPLIEAGQWRKYLDSLFWAMDTWSTVGFGNPAPFRWMEQVMVLGIEYMYIFFFSLTAALFGNFLSEFHEANAPADFRGRIGKLDAWLESRRISYHLSMKVKQFYLGLWAPEPGLNEAELLMELPVETRDEILKAKALPVVRDTDFLKGLSSHEQESIAIKMIPKTVAAGDSLYIKGAPADSLFAIEAGCVRIRNFSGGYKDLGRGQLVGLSAIFAENTPSLAKRFTSPTAMTNTTLWEIKIFDMEGAAELAPNAWQYILDNADFLTTEFGITPGIENRNKAAATNPAEESFEGFIDDILRHNASSPVLNFEPVVEGMYNPTSLGIFQPSQKLLRVNAAEWGQYVDEAQTRGNSGAMISPISKFSVTWSWFMAIFDLVFAVCVLPQIIQFVIDNDPKEVYPLKFVVPSDADGNHLGPDFVDYRNIKDSHVWGRALLWIAGCIYMIDMILGFVTGFVVSHSNKAMIVKDFSSVWHYYLTKGGFFVDLLSIIPFIYEIAAVHDVPGDRTDQILNIIRSFARYGRVYWILKEIYIHSILNHWTLPTYPFFDRIQPTLVYFGYVIYTLFGIINWSGALLYLAARWRGLDHSWLAVRIHLPRVQSGIVLDGANCMNCHSLLGGDLETGPSEWSHWIGGLFYAIDTLLTNGNGEPHPVTWNEEISSLIIMVLQVYYFGFVLGATLDLFKSARNVVERSEKNRLKMKSMESFFLTRRLPKQLQDIIQSFYTEVWSRVVDFDEAEILEGLPDDIRQEVVFSMLSPVYHKLELFDRFTDKVLLTMSGLLTPSVVARDAQLYSEGDDANAIYILEYGHVVALENNVLRAKLQGPSTIGEEIITPSGQQDAKREFTVETKSSCFLWTLHTAGLAALDEEHDGALETLQSILSSIQSAQGPPTGAMKKKTSSLRRLMSEKSMKSTAWGDQFINDPNPPMAYQPRTCDVSPTEWFYLTSVPENERRSSGVINPNSTLALYSSSFMFIFDGTYTAFVMPALIAFVQRDNDELLPDWAFALEVIAGLIFIASMILNMTTGYIAQYDHRSITVMRRKDILVNYFKQGTFWIDLVSVLPFFYEIIARAEGGDETANEFLSALRMLRLIRVFRVLQLIWNVSFSVDTRQLGWMLRTPSSLNWILKAPTLLWMVNIFYVFYFFSNVWAAMLYMLGKAEQGEGPDSKPGDRSWMHMRWMPTSDGLLLADDQVTMRYLHSLYWAMDTLGTVGFGDPWPNTWQEDLALTICMFNAVLLFSVIFASTSTVLKSLREDVRRFDRLRTRMNGVVEWMNIRGFTPELKRTVRSYYSEKLSSASNLDVEILNDMPEGIKSNVLHYVTQNVMNELDLFKNVDRFQKELIAAKLTPHTVASGHDLFERDDLANGVYLLEAGTLLAVNGATEVGRVNGPATIANYTLVNAAEPHPVTVRAKTDCYLWHLEESALDDLCKDDSTLRIELIGGEEQQMKSAWAQCNGGLLDARVDGGKGGNKTTKPMLGKTIMRYSLRNVVRYHDVSPARWGALSTGAGDHAHSKEDQYHKASLVAKKTGAEVPFSPDNPLPIAWSGYMMIFDAVYIVFLLPVIFSFGLGRDYAGGDFKNPLPRKLELETWVHPFEWFAGITFFVNTFMNIATGFVAQHNNQKVIVKGTKQVFENYITKGTLIIDILSILPFFFYLAVLGGADSGGAKHAYTWLLLLRFFPRFILFLFDLASTCFAGKNALPILVDYMPSSTFYFWLTVYVSALTFNVFGCFYFFSAVWRKTRPDDSWVGAREMDMEPLMEANIGKQYLDSIYWCSDTLTTVGYGDPQPTTWEEMLVAMAIMIFNIYFFILIESAISELLRDTAAKEEFRKKKASKKDWLLRVFNQWELDTDIQQQVVGFYEDKWDKTTVFDEDALIAELPSALRSQVALELKN